MKVPKYLKISVVEETFCDILTFIEINRQFGCSVHRTLFVISSIIFSEICFNTLYIKFLKEEDNVLHC